MMEIEGFKKGTIQERLDHLRQALGYATLTDWHDRVAEDYECSYQAIRRWHSDREPPISYVDAVARIGNANLEWLIRGEGPVLAGERQEGAPFVNDELSYKLAIQMRRLVFQLSSVAAFADTIADTIEGQKSED